MAQKTKKLSDLLAPSFHATFNSKITHQSYSSGRFATKTSMASLKVVERVIADPECAAVVVRRRHNKIGRTVFKEIKRAFKRLGVQETKRESVQGRYFRPLKSPFEIKYKPNGNTIYFSGVDNQDDVKGMIDENKAIKILWFEEFQEFFHRTTIEDAEAVINNVIATFSRSNNDYFIVMYTANPPRNSKSSYYQWVKKMKRRNDFIHIHNDYREVDPSWIGSLAIKEAEQMRMNDEKMYRWLYLGEAIGLDDGIFYMFNEDEHVVEEFDDRVIRKLDYVSASCDVGYKNATIFEFAGIDYKESCLKRFHEWSHSGRETGIMLSPNEYARKFKEQCDWIFEYYGVEVEYCIIDPSAKGLGEEIKRVMPSIKVRDANNKVELGITRCQKVLSLKAFKMKRQGIHYVAKNRRLVEVWKDSRFIQEVGDYEFDPKMLDKGIEVPVKVDDHAMDSFRYLVMHLWIRLRRMLNINEKG